jgi:beta-mannanase
MREIAVIGARHVAQVALAALLLLLTAVSASAMEIGSAVRPLRPVSRAPQQTATTPKLGMWIPGAPGNQQAIQEVEALIGRELDIVHWYQAWGSATNSAFRTESLAKIHATGATALISWEPWTPGQGVAQPEYSLRAIAAGAHDAYIRDWAQAARDADGPILIRFAHEMNGDWYPWASGVNGNTAADYVAAWNHVRGVFLAEGATNVQFVWSPNVEYPGSAPLADLFPGDGAVDWVGMDGYNWGTEKAGSSWRSFDTTFSATYAKLATLSSRPMMIAETASAEAGGNKAKWIREGLSLRNLQTNFPRVAAVVWFNEKKSGNWPIQSSSQATKALADVVQGWR